MQKRVDFDSCRYMAFLQEAVQANLKSKNERFSHEY